MPSHDSGDSDSEHDGLSFIGISFSVNTANGNPYSYQLCHQYRKENIIGRNYDVIDSSHTETQRIGNLDPDSGYVYHSIVVPSYFDSLRPCISSLYFSHALIT